MLEVHDIKKSFDGFAAVAGVSFAAERRQIAAVIGPNGAGKSTLFNIITGHLRPDAGRVWLAGRDITGAAPHRICRMGIIARSSTPAYFRGSRCSRTCRPLISPIAGAVRISGRARTPSTATRPTP